LSGFNNNLPDSVPSHSIGFRAWHGNKRKNNINRAKPG
jgi:hypothetical protein